MHTNTTATMLKSILACAAFMLSAHAIAADAKPATAAAPASAAITPAKQELIDRILKSWHLEVIGQTMVRESVGDAVNQARAMLQGRVVPEKRDAAMKDIADEARKFLDDALPIVNNSTQKIVPATVAPMLAERFTEDELRQILAMLESPLKKKFEAMLPDVQKALGARIAADARPQLDPKLQDLQQKIGMRLRTAVNP